MVCHEVYETCKELEDAGYAMQKAPDAGSMKGRELEKTVPQTAEELLKIELAQVLSKNKGLGSIIYLCFVLISLFLFFSHMSC